MSNQHALSRTTNEPGQLLDLYVNVRRRNPLSIIHVATTNKNRVAAHGVELRSTRDISSTFVSIRQFLFGGSDWETYSESC